MNEGTTADTERVESVWRATVATLHDGAPKNRRKTPRTRPRARFFYFFSFSFFLTAPRARLPRRRQRLIDAVAFVARHGREHCFLKGPQALLADRGKERI